MATPIKILSVLAEGGGLDIWGIQRSDAWVFKMDATDHTPTMIGEDAINLESVWRPSIDDVLQEVLWPWNRMRPHFVHPDFGEEIFRLKSAKDKAQDPGCKSDKRWASACGVTLAPDPPVGSDGLIKAANLERQETAVPGHLVAFKKSQGVRHSAKPDWGLGRVLENSNAHSVRILFEHRGEMEMALPTAYLQVTVDDLSYFSKSESS